jgi:hypothetical protein
MGQPYRGFAITLTELLNHRLQLIQVGLVLQLVLHLLLDTFQNPHGGRVVVNLSGCSQSGLDDLGSGHQIVCETVVESSLELEDVLDLGKEGLVSGVEGLVRFVLVVVRARAVSDG